MTTATWLFAYGSLIWRPDIPFEERVDARLAHWARRFWQGSHDHRGTPQAPGRVVTLVEQTGEHCDGVAYRLPASTLPSTLAYLDHREKNGYRRQALVLALADGREVDGFTYVADSDNEAWLGETSLQAMAEHIAGAHGPSGSNLAYLLNLDDALRERHFVDAHVHELASMARRLARLDPPEPL